jgi:hypothetical protein
VVGWHVRSTRRERQESGAMGKSEMVWGWEGEGELRQRMKSRLRTPRSYIGKMRRSLHRVVGIKIVIGAKFHIA